MSDIERAVANMKASTLAIRQVVEEMEKADAEYSRRQRDGLSIVRTHLDKVSKTLAEAK